MRTSSDSCAEPIADYGTMVISNSTISRNQAGGYGQMFCSYNPGGNVYTSGRLILRNTIVAYGMGTNCEGPITSDGYNLSDDSSCNFHNSGDRNNIDPKLGTLGSMADQPKLFLCSLEALRLMLVTRVAARTARAIC